MSEQDHTRLDVDMAHLLSQPVPPGLNARVLGPVEARPAWARALPWLLAAAVTMFAVWPHPPDELWLTDGSHLVSGHQLVRVGHRTIEVDGLVQLKIEPDPVRARVTGAGGATVNPRSRMRLAGVGAVVTVLVVEGVAWVADAGAQASELGPGERVVLGEPRARFIPPPQDPVPAEDLSGRVAQLEMENAVLRKLLEDMRLEFLGTPMPWTDDIPQVLRPEAFERNVREAIASCEPAVELLGFECNEPPCFTLLRPTGEEWWDDLVNTCGPWVDHYTKSVSSASFSVTCEDGSEERGQMLGWSTHLIEDQLSSEQEGNARKRFSARVAEARLNWRCTDE